MTGRLNRTATNADTWREYVRRGLVFAAVP